MTISFFAPRPSVLPGGLAHLFTLGLLLSTGACSTDPAPSSRLDVPFQRDTVFPQEPLFLPLDSLRWAQAPGPLALSPLEANERALEAVDEAYGSLPTGAVAFNSPNEMELGETTTIEFVVSSETALDTLRSRVAAEGPVVARRVRVAPDLTATLTPTTSGLEVRPSRARSQMLGRTRDARWQWTVVATDDGLQALSLRLTARVTVGDERREIELDTFQEEIQIRVGFGKRVALFVGAHWQWLWAMIVLPLLGLAYRRFRKTPPSETADAATPHAAAPESPTDQGRPDAPPPGPAP